MGEDIQRDEKKVLKDIASMIQNLKAQSNGKLPLEKKIEILDENLEVATKMTDIKMKSIVQTYDIRDSPEFKGVLMIEILLQSVPRQ